jgi:pyrimidine operon attenuation protein/uracil phosphoribosyltransferase
VPTSRDEVVRVRVEEVDGEDAVDIEQASVDPVEPER